MDILVSPTGKAEGMFRNFKGTVVKTVDEAFALVKSGDAVYFKSGTVHEALIEVSRKDTQKLGGEEIGT